MVARADRPREEYWVPWCETVGNLPNASILACDAAALNSQRFLGRAQRLYHPTRSAYARFVVFSARSVPILNGRHGSRPVQLIWF
jgi:hypothetical protein